jgi:hypothetical protein
MADDKSGKVPTFDGSQKKFVIWWTRFQAYAEEKGFAQAIENTKEPDMPISQAACDALDTTLPASAKAVKAIARNKKAVSSFAMAFTNAKAMVHHHKGTDAVWPKGLACNITKSLLKKYQPQDNISKVEYIQALRQFKLKKNQDPSEVFDHIVEVNAQFGMITPSDEMMVAMALEKLPREYVNAYTTLSMTQDKWHKYDERFAHEESSTRAV